jgi:hypothetical protein
MGSESIMIISNDAQLSSTTTTRTTRYFSVTSMLIFSTRPFFPPIFLISRLPHSVFLTFLTLSPFLPHFPHPVFLTPSFSLRLPHSVFLTPSSSLLPHSLFLTSSSSLRLPHSVFLILLPHFQSIFNGPSSSAHDAKSLPLSSPFPCLRSFPT